MVYGFTSLKSSDLLRIRFTGLLVYKMVFDLDNHAEIAIIDNKLHERRRELLGILHSLKISLRSHKAYFGKSEISRYYSDRTLDTIRKMYDRNQDELRLIETALGIESKPLC